MLEPDIVDQLLDDDRLPDACAPEESGLTTLDVGRDEVDDLDPRLEDLGLRFEVCEAWWLTVDRPSLGIGGDLTTRIDGIAGEVWGPSAGGLTLGGWSGGGRVGGTCRA